jgi:hypothetical protein
MAALSLFGRSQSALNGLNDRNDVLEITRSLMGSTSCDQSFPLRPVECDDGTELVRLYDAKGRIIVDKPTARGGYTKVGGKISVRARCVPCDTCSFQKKVVIEVARSAAPKPDAAGTASSRQKSEQKFSNPIGAPLACSIPDRT